MDTVAYRTARLTADAHIQLRLFHAETWPNTTLVVGKVDRVFRDKTGRLKRGEVISFDQPFTSRIAPDAGPTRETWARAKAAEAYLRASEGYWRVTCDQFTLLRRPTLWPVNRANNDRGWFAIGPGLSQDEDGWSDQVAKAVDGDAHISLCCPHRTGRL
jgi:hypothetical protein